MTEEVDLQSLKCIGFVLKLKRGRIGEGFDEEGV